LRAMFRKKGPIRTTWLVFAIVIVLISLPLVPSFAGEFRVTRVHDGETLRVEGHGIEIVVRLAGIEVPTASPPQSERSLAVEAKSYLAELTLNKMVDLKGHGLDEMNRVLGVVMIQQMNVNLEMIKAGYAMVYRGDPAHPLYLLPYVKAEEVAKRSRKGIWARDIRVESAQQSEAGP
jgi:micrococcal nuclease